MKSTIIALRSYCQKSLHHLSTSMVKFFPQYVEIQFFRNTLNYNYFQKYIEIQLFRNTMLQATHCCTEVL